MPRSVRTTTAATLATLAVAVAIIAAALTAPASASLPPTCAGHIVAQRLEDGRVQVVWEDRGRPSWRVVPNQRYFPADAQVDRWLQSSPIEVGGFSLISIDARLRSDGRIEFAYSRIGWKDWRDPNDRERILPDQRYFPVNAPVGRWLYSSRIRYVCQLYPLEWFRRQQP